MVRNRADEDEELARWVGRRDEAALEALIVRHRPMVAAVCRRIMGPGVEAGEVGDEVFADLAAGAEAIRGPVGAWLRSCATHRAYRRRSRRACLRLDESAVGTCPTGGADCDGGRLRTQITAVLEVLDDRQRGAIEQRFFHGRTPDEIAMTAGISPHAVRRRIGSALERLRREPRVRQLYAEAL